MIKGLKVAMIVYAVIGILMGLAYIFLPDQFLEMGGFEEGPAYVAAFEAVIGASYIAACVFLIIAARDPLKNILWVKFATLFAILQFAAELYSFIRGYTNFEQGGMAIIVHAVFAVAFLALYPYGKAKST
jgi:hypothetical protein